MTEHDYDNGYRAGMQKMRDLAQARIDEMEENSDVDGDEVEYIRVDIHEARINEMEEALFDMVDLFSADDIFLKGNRFAALKQARAALQTRRIEASQRNKRNKLEERIKKLEDELSHLEEMRPFWAKGYSSDSEAAQASTGALSSIWRCLGVKDQTACMYALEELKKHKENGRMTKLEELKADYDAAEAAVEAIWSAADDDVRAAARDAAWAAYQDELKKTQEENSDGH
jgi:hypothetical protein